MKMRNNMMKRRRKKHSSRNQLEVLRSYRSKTKTRRRMSSNSSSRRIMTRHLLKKQRLRYSNLLITPMSLLRRLKQSIK